MKTGERALSIVIPVYNSEAILPTLLGRIEAVFSSRPHAFEVILVDDGSSDGSWQAIEQLSAERTWLHGFRMMRNYGQHNALLCGIRAAKHELIVTMDDDLQHPPEEIPSLLERLDDSVDVVYGTPQAEQHGLGRNLASQVTKIVLQGSMGAETARKVSAFRVFRTQLRDAFANYQSQFVSIDVLLTWGTTRFAVLPVRHDPRTIGQSQYTIRKLTVHALNMMTGFSTFPLQLASLTGFAFTVFGFFVLLYIIGRFLIQGTTVPGFPFLASIIAIFSGAQLFALGIIGEYLARMHFRMIDRPTYAVRTSTSDVARP
jgi:undecaprenyl-phosphate 4-deoxy-4-formamido-L-arabinose transferase